MLFVFFENSRVKVTILADSRNGSIRKVAKVSGDLLFQKK